MSRDDDEQENRGGGGLTRLRDVVHRRKWGAVLVFVGAFTILASLVWLRPDVYRSSATILIERQQIPDDLVKSTVTGALETRLQTISQEVLSRNRLEPLVDRFGLYPELRRQGGSLEKAAEQMRSDIDIQLRGGEKKGDRATVAFTVTYTGRDPGKVAQVTNALASFYIEENLKVRERQAMGTADFLRSRLQEVRQTLEEQEKRVSDFKESHLGELPQQTQANLATLEQLNTQLRLNSDKQTRIGERRSQLMQQITDAEAPTGPGPAAAAALRLAQLEKNLAELRGRFSDKYPDVVRIQAEIAAVQAEMQGGQGNPPARPAAPAANLQSLQLRRTLADVEAEYSGLKAEATNLTRSLAVYHRRVENAPRREQEYQGVSRDYEATKDLYRSLSERYREAELAESMEQRQKGEQFRILDPATLSAQPAAPNRRALLLMVLAFSLALALVSMAVRESLDSSFHSVEDLRAASALPVLMGIPQIVTRGDRRRMRARFALGVLSTLAGVALIVSSAYVLARHDGRLASLLLR